ncbi:MAG: glycosyltransferase family 4 protein, partial [Thermoanaerobaculia bacterium]|nr:glycosyltransferase family 4 protein [Thermoanaerobaculia bacterium]
LVVSEGLQRLYADRDHRTLYLPNGIDLPDPHPPSRIESELGLRGEDYLLFLGRWAGEKRVLELIEAFSELRCRGLKLVVAGTAEPETSHGRKTHRLASSTPGVILPGTVEGKLKEELLSNAFAFVSFSEVEGMPMALLEAMSHERPCLVSDIPAHRELLNGGRGLLRDVTTPRSRVDALRDLVSLSPTERRRMGRRAREDLHPTHDWDRLVDELERLYAEVAGGTG